MRCAALAIAAALIVGRVRRGGAASRLSGGPARSRRHALPAGRSCCSAATVSSGSSTSRPGARGTTARPSCPGATRRTGSSAAATASCSTAPGRSWPGRGSAAAASSGRSSTVRRSSSPARTRDGCGCSRPAPRRSASPPPARSPRPGARRWRPAKPPPGWPERAARSGLLLSPQRPEARALGPAAPAPSSTRSTRAGSATSAPIHGDTLASCVYPCHTLRLTDVRTGAQRRFRAPGRLAFEPFNGAFSSTGGELAVPVAPPGSHGRAGSPW